jgi:hypothetical protein
LKMNVIRRHTNHEPDASWVHLLSSETMMVEILERECSQDEDRYFGLLGIIRPDLASGAAIKISDNLEDVYRLLFFDLLHWTSSLNILLFTAPFEAPETPS